MSDTITTGAVRTEPAPQAEHKPPVRRRTALRRRIRNLRATARRLDDHALREPAERAAHWSDAADHLDGAAAALETATELSGRKRTAALDDALEQTRRSNQSVVAARTTEYPPGWSGTADTPTDHLADIVIPPPEYPPLPDE